MLRKWLQAWLGQQKQEPTRSEVVETIERFERSLKRLGGDIDEQIEKTRALNARMTRLLDRAEKTAQQPPGPTIGTSEGSPPPPPGPDRWVALAEIRKRKAGAA